MNATQLQPPSQRDSLWAVTQNHNQKRELKSNWTVVVVGRVHWAVSTADFSSNKKKADGWKFARRQRHRPVTKQNCVRTTITDDEEQFQICLFFLTVVELCKGAFKKPFDWWRNGPLTHSHLALQMSSFLLNQSIERYFFKPFKYFRYLKRKERKRYPPPFDAYSSAAAAALFLWTFQRGCSSYRSKK